MQTGNAGGPGGYESTSLCSHHMRVWTPQAAGFRAPEKLAMLQLLFFFPLENKKH